MIYSREEYMAFFVYWFVSLFSFVCLLLSLLSLFASPTLPR